LLIFSNPAVGMLQNYVKKAVAIVNTFVFVTHAAEVTFSPPKSTRVRLLQVRPAGRSTILLIVPERATARLHDT
jgi:hypothetical protein